MRELVETGEILPQEHRALQAGPAARSDNGVSDQGGCMSDEYKLTLKKGKWIEREVICGNPNVIEDWQSAKCSVCGRYHTTPYMYYFSDYNFCPNCGADMREDT